MFRKFDFTVIAAGVWVGAAALLLTLLGNPANMGFCIACFLRDIAGAMQLHSAQAVQYVRPEIIGLVLGAAAMSIVAKEFQPRAGSSPATRFVIGAIVMAGALVFLGCPLRMVLRMAGGDGNAYVGFAGFVCGILIGIFFLRRGFSLKRSYSVAKTEAAVFPALAIVLFLLVLLIPQLFAFSKSGPGSQHAAVLPAFGLAFVAGAMAQKSRLCMVGGMRDLVMFRDFRLLSGFAAIFLFVLIGNIASGNLTGFSTYLQPIAHADHAWNFLGMVIVGWGSVLLGGCPLRQLILAGEGNGDSAVTVLGMIVGAALAHNWKIAGSAASMVDGVYAAGGVGMNGRVAVIAGLVLLLLISLVNTQKQGGKTT